METGHDEPKAFDIIFLLLLRGRCIVTGYEPITFASKISYPNENQDYSEKDEPPNHMNPIYRHKVKDLGVVIQTRRPSGRPKGDGGMELSEAKAVLRPPGADPDGARSAMSVGREPRG